MKENFDTAFKQVVGHEGGFTNDRRDRGNWTSGVIGKGTLSGTKFGISAMSYPTIDIKNLTIEQAKEIYRRDFWNKAYCDLLPSGSDYLMFDTAVNHGVSRAAQFLQAALKVTVDGKIGNQTLTAASQADPVELAADFAVARMEFYTEMGSWYTYGKGWSKRCVQSLATALKMRATAVLDQSIAEVPETSASILGKLFRRV